MIGSYSFNLQKLVMFSQAKKQRPAQVTADKTERNTMPVPAQFNPNPNFKRDVLQAAGKKLQDALSISCDQHNQTARLENGKIVGCCDDLEKRVAEFLESK